MFALADELHGTSTVSDDLFADPIGNFDDEQILKLCVTAGCYRAINDVINAARLPLEQRAARFPE